MIRESHCSDCPNYYQHMDFTAVCMHGKLVNFGERICKGVQSYRKFRSKDPKRKIPSWCPRLLDPPMLRVYEFKDTESWYMHKMFGSLPLAYRYCVNFEGPAPISPKEFWKHFGHTGISFQLPFYVQTGWVVEFDDGIRQLFFYCTDKGFDILTGFQSDVARSNPRREPVQE